MSAQFLGFMGGVIAETLGALARFGGWLFGASRQPDPQALLLAGQRAQDSGNYAEARGRYAAAANLAQSLLAATPPQMAHQPVLVAALLAGAELDLADGQRAAALDAYRQAALLGELPTAASDQLALDDAANQRQQPAAIGRYLAYIANHRGQLPPEDPVLALVRVLVQTTPTTTQPQLEAATSLAERLINTDRSLAWAHSAYGMALARLGRLPAATHALLRAEAATPGDWQIAGELAGLYLAQGDTTAASAALSRSLRANPQQPERLLHLIELLIARGDLAGAAAQLRQVAHAAPDAAPLAQGWVALGHAYMAEGQPTQANVAFVRALAASPTSAAAYDGLGRLAEERGDRVSAINSYQQALALQPAAQPIQRRLALALAKNADWASALEQMQALPDDAELANWRGLVLARLGRYAEAIATWQPLLAQHPGDAALANNLLAARYQLGAERFAAGDPAGALGCWERCCRERPAEPAFRLALAAAYQRLGVQALAARGGQPNLLVAQALFEQAAALGSNDPQLGLYRALTALALAPAPPPPALLSALQAALDAPQAAPAARALVLARAWLLVVQGQPHDASQALAKLAADAPAAAHTSHVLLVAAQGKPDAALGLLSGLAGTPATSHAHLTARLRLQRAAQSLAAGRTEAAEADLLGALQLEADLLPAHQLLQYIYDQRARLYLQASRLDDTIGLLERGFVLRPTDMATVHRLAVLYYQRAAELSANPGSESADRVVGYWCNVIAYWATVLASTAFWARWRAYPGAPAPEPGVIDQMRKAFEADMLQDIRNLADNEHQPEREAFGDLEVHWLLELQAAQLLAEWQQETALAGWPAGLACGPLMLARLRGNHAALGYVAALEAALPAHTRLQIYLSPLGRYQVLIDQGRYAQAISALEALNPTETTRRLIGEAQMLHAIELTHAQHWRLAQRAFSAAHASGIDLRPQAELIATASLYAAREFYQQDRDAAIDTLEQGLDLAGDQPLLHAELGQLYAEQARLANQREQFATAVHFARTALRHTPESPTARHTARVVLENLAATLDDQRPDQAISLLKEALSYEPHQPTSGWLANLLFDAALAAAGNDHYQQAVDSTRQALMYAGNLPALASGAEAREFLKGVLLGQIAELVDQGNLEAAIVRARQARLYGDDWQTFGRQMQLLLQAHRAVEALALWRAAPLAIRSAEDLHDLLVQALIDSAAAAERGGNDQLAIELLREALNYTNEAYIFLSLGSMYLRHTRYAEATSIFRNGLQAHPDEPHLIEGLHTALHNSGVQALEASQLDQAISFLQMALNVLPDDETRKSLVDARLKRAQSRWRNQRSAAAGADILAALQIDPHNQALRDLLNQLEDGDALSN